MRNVLLFGLLLLGIGACTRPVVYRPQYPYDLGQRRGWHKPHPHGMPPGQAKKIYGKVPPGQAKKRRW